MNNSILELGYSKSCERSMGQQSGTLMVSSKMYPGPRSQKNLGRRTSHKDGGNYSCSVVPYLDRRGNYGFRVSNMTLLFPVALRPNAGHSLLILEVPRSHTTTHYSR